MKSPFTWRVAISMLAACSVLLLGAAPLVAEEEAASMAAETDVAINVITAIDKDSREITLKDDSSGEKWVYTAGPEVRNFDQLERGDIVIAERFEGVAVALGPKGSGLKDRVSEVDMERAAPGDKPGMSVTESTYVEAEIVEVDADRGIVAIEGPERLLTLQVGEEVDLSGVEVGQVVELLYVESVSISVETAPEVSGTLEMQFKAVALGVGFEWGEGILTMYDGTVHEFKVKGMTLLDVGMSAVKAEGEVYRLVEAKDLAGTFLTGQAGAALVGGGSAMAMKNGNGVVVKLKASQEGARLTLAAEGLRIELK